MPPPPSLSPPAPSAAAVPSARRLHSTLALIAVVPVLMLAALATYALVASRAQYERRAELLTQNLAAAVDHSVSANIEKIDLALSSIVDHLESQLAAGALDRKVASAQIRSQIAHRPELEGIRVTDASGTGVLGPGLESGPPVSFAEREWFQVQRDRSDAGFHMSKPLVSKIAKVWIVSFSRRYRGADGRFAGAVSAAVPLSYFRRELDALGLGPHGAVLLRGADMGLITRHPPSSIAAANEVGNRVAPATLIEQVSAGRLHGSIAFDATADGLARTSSFRRLAVAPMLVIVSLAAEDYLADWRREVKIVVGACVAFLLLYAAGVALLARTLEQNRRARHRIGLLANVFEHTGEAIIMTDADNRIIEVNPAFEQLTGYTAAEVTGRNPRFLASGRTPPAQYAEMWEALQTSGRWRGELWDRNKDGREYPTWLTITAVRDAEGRIVRHIASSIDMTEVKQAEDKIRHLAHHDTLTQLPNRVHLLGRLEQAMASARRDGHELAMLFIDMDRFKNINDTLGHHVGDGLLVQVGRRLRTLVRDSDIVARLGGDEFVLVLAGQGSPGGAARAAAAVSQKVIHALGLPYLVDGHELHSTPSIGIGIFPGDGSDPDTLMKNADTAMYHAKSAGRNNYQFFTAAMNEATAERLALEVGLRTAIERNELFVHYQPQVDVPSGRVVAFEALLRWRHPTLGVVPPLKFIAIAEDTGQIEAIGAWVLEQALAQVARWHAAGRAPLRVAVNLSAQQLRTDAFVPLVAQALRRHGLPGSALELEITESVAMRDPQRTAEMLRQLRRHGVTLAIDDFGTGHSSLAYLKQLPLNCLKLDRSFVMDIENDPNDAAICTATIQMAHSLGLGVVAEGVETAAQLAFLRQLGCDTVQGYFFSKPMSPEDCDAFLRRSEAAVEPA